LLSWCIITIHLNARQQVQEPSTSSSQSIAVDSHSSFVTTRSQHLFSPQNSNNASPPLLTKSSSCAKAFPTALMILRNLASILPQLLFVYGTRAEQVRRAHDLFNKGRWEDLWNWPSRPGREPKLAPPKFLVRARPSPNRKKTSAHKNVCAQATCQKLL